MIVGAWSTSKSLAQLFSTGSQQGQGTVLLRDEIDHV